jgi:glycosyltransferase involved in cell wall biosynthesis
MKISFIITSFNQKKRLFYSLQSAIHQKLSNDNDYEIILADDNSTDGPIEMVKKHFPSVRISLNNKSIPGKFTTASNKNCAIKMAQGDRLVLSNGDVIFSSGFIDSYCNPIWENNVVFGPCERSDEKIDNYLTNLLIPIKDEIISTPKLNNHKEIVRILSDNNWLYPDPHHDGSVYTYNNEYSVIHPWGGNMSVMRDHFEEVDGFPEYDFYGGEEDALTKKIVDMFKVKVVSNGKSYSIHLWHPQYNNNDIKIRPEYEL